MENPSETHPLRKTYKPERLSDLPSSKPSQSQRKTKQIRDRIDEIKEQRALEALFGELGDD